MHGHHHCHHEHCHCHRHHHYVKMVKFVMLVGLFVALVPGVLLTLNFGLKGKLAPVLIHGVIFAIVYCGLSHAYWCYVKNQHMRMRRKINQALMEEAALEQIVNVRMHQEHQEHLLASLAKKCDGGNKE